MTDDSRPNFPGQNFPVAFADLALSLSIGSGVVKFYLGRYDPAFDGIPGSQITAVGQVVMPLDGFIGTFAFFEAQINSMIKSGVVSRESLENARAVFATAKPDA